MKLIKYLYGLCCLTGITACENPVSTDLNVDNAASYTRIYTINAYDDVSKNTMLFRLDRDTTFRVYANLGGIVPSESDITVRFKIAPELMESYNATRETPAYMIPEDCYSVENLETIIPAGQLVSNPIVIRVDGEHFNGVGPYILPITIESVSPDYVVQESLRTAFLHIGGYYLENPFQPYDKDDWQITACSSEEQSSGSGCRKNLIDDDDDTFWSTASKTEKPGPPHWIVVDMNSQLSLHGINLRARDNEDAKFTNIPKTEGNPRILNIEVSDDNLNWAFVDTFTLENLIEHELFFSRTVAGRYLRLTIVATQGDSYQGSIAELTAF